MSLTLLLPIRDVTTSNMTHFGAGTESPGERDVRSDECRYGFVFGPITADDVARPQFGQLDAEIRTPGIVTTIGSSTCATVGGDRYVASGCRLLLVMSRNGEHQWVGHRLDRQFERW